MESRKKIIIAVLLLLIIGGGVWWFISARRKNSLSKITESTQVEQAQKFQLKEMNQEIYSYLKTAAKQKKPEMCDKFILSLDRDNCLMYVFQISTDVAVCQKISDEPMKKDCLDLDIFYRAIKEKNLKACLTINNADYKNQCLKMLVGDFSKIEDCSGQTGEIKSLCESAVYYKIALKEKKLALCDKIAESAYNLDCRTTLENLSPDSDNDGLSDDYEIQLSTDPFNPDTDGDGMNDGDELKAHRNPLIKGK